MGTELRRPNTKIRIMSSFAPASDAATATARPHFHVKDIFVSEKAPCLGATKFHYAQCGTTGSLLGIWAHPTAGYGAMLKVLDAMVEEPKPRQVARGQRSSRSSALDLLRWRNHCNMAPISCASV